MTISDNDAKIVYEADGVQDTFAYDFKIFASTDLAVYEDSALTIKSYTVSDVGEDAGGDVVFSSDVPADGVMVTLVRISEYAQESEYTAYDPFPAETHEETLDKLVMQIQQLKAEVDRCLKLPRWDETTDPELGSIPTEAVASKGLGFDGSGQLDLLSTTDYDLGNDLDMDGNDIYLTGGLIYARNNEIIIAGRDQADSAYDNLVKYNASDLIEFLQNVQMANGTDINEFSIDGTLAGDSDDAVPTEQAVKQYVDDRQWEYESEVTPGAVTSFDLSLTIPSDVTDIEILIDGLKVNANSEPPLIQLGDSGGFETSGYSMGVGEVDGATAAEEVTVAGILTGRTSLYGANEGIDGIVRLIRYSASSNLWFATGTLVIGAAHIGMVGGNKELTAVLDRIQFTTPSGTDNYAGGSVTIRYKRNVA